MRSKIALLPSAGILAVIVVTTALGQDYAEAWRLTGFAAPESASYDPGTDTVFVSNINSPDFSANGMGYISQLSLEGKVIAEHFVDGLNVPAGTDVRDGT